MSEEMRQTGHGDAERHHHHSHAKTSHHPGGHHLLTVEHLSVSFSMYDTQAPFFSARHIEHTMISDMSISVHAGEVVAVVGASGSGKTLLADALMGLYEPNARVEGNIWFDGVLQDAASLAQLRGHGISLVPQSVTHLDPLMPVGEQVLGAFPRGRVGRVERARRQRRMEELFAAYRLDPSVMRRYPHELSGGMLRRILIMCALMDDPKLIVADEPTPGLDLDLAVRALGDLRSFANDGGGVMLITHDLELALRVADRVAVFYEGQIVEETATASFARSDTLEHPFTRALWHALPEQDFCAVPLSRGEE